MPVLILDADVAEQVRHHLESFHPERANEVWEGVYVVPPIANNEHQGLGVGFVWALHDVLGPPPASRLFGGCNVSDRELDWTHNYRCPDVAIFLAGNPARDCLTHWCGGPDFLVEILSRDDRSHDKLPFYALVGVREVLIVDRDPWQLELYGLKVSELILVGRSDPSSATPVASSVLPLSFALEPGTPRPAIVITHTDGRTWRI